MHVALAHYAGPPTRALPGEACVQVLHVRDETFLSPEYTPLTGYTLLPLTFSTPPVSDDLVLAVQELPVFRRRLFLVGSCSCRSWDLEKTTKVPL